MIPINQMKKPLEPSELRENRFTTGCHIDSSELTPSAMSLSIIA